MKKISMASVFGLLLAVSAFSQTDLFDQDFSGIHPYAGLKWNSKITQPLIGFDYVVEGRTALGIQAGFPLKDTLFSSPGEDSVVGKFHSVFVNPYVVFELVEPDNLSNFSFLMRADFIYESAASDDSLNGFSRSSFGVGPVFAYAFQTSDKFSLIPAASYEFYYVKWKRDWPTHRTISGNVPLYNNDYFIQHDIGLGVDAVYHLSETQGLNFEPKVVLKLGEGLLGSDLFNIQIGIGYFASF